MAPNGEEALTYASKLSLVSNAMLFQMNFCISLILSQIFESAKYSAAFVLPFLLQLIILFFYSKMLGCQLRVYALDKFASTKKQSDFITTTQLLIYLFAIVIILLMNEFFLNKFLVLTYFGSLWLPQIYRNTLKSLKDGPDLNYCCAASVHALLIPVYFKLVEQNFLL
mmetsp:Transcript_15785/g.26650  ORF Transcript_15785/g.26650 Transcript_15785/m.26650 type:complete len:168 (+) Transcript_15785:990-1493(+)